MPSAGWYHSSAVAHAPQQRGRTPSQGSGQKLSRGLEWGDHRGGRGKREAWRRWGGRSWEGKLCLSQCFPSLWPPRDVSQQKVFLMKVWESLEFGVSTWN